jgi:hypothetical protein
MAETYGSKTLKSVKWYMAHFWDIKRAVSQSRADQHRRASIPGTPGDKYKISDPTGQEAVSNLMPVKWVEIDGGRVKDPEKWIYVIETVFKRLPETEQQIIRDNFWSKKGWLYVSTMRAMDAHTFYKRRDHAVTMMAITAAQEGLIKIGDD